MKTVRTRAAMLRTLSEVAMLPRLTSRLLSRKRIRIFGLGRLREGAVVATAHVGNWELAAQALGAVAGPASVLYRPDPRPLVERWLARHRDPAVEFIPAGPAGFRLALRRLKARRRVVVTVDRERAITFSTCRAAAALARRAGAPLIPALLIRRRGMLGRPRRGLRYKFAALVGRPVFASPHHLAEVMNRLVLRYDGQWCQQPRCLQDARAC